MFAEAKELERMLHNLQRGITYDLLSDDGRPSTSDPALVQQKSEQRRSSAKSSWARSGSKREFPGSVHVKAVAEMTASHASADLARAEKNLKKRSAAYTMGKSKRDDDMLTPRPVTADVDFYDANVEAASTTKRSRSVIFSTAKRAGPFDVIAGSEPAAMVTDDERNDGEDSDRGRRVVSTREAALTLDGQRRAPAFSFGRAPRAPVSDEADAKAEAKDGGGDGHVAMLDVTRAERYLRPNVAVALIRPPSIIVGGEQHPATNDDDDDEEEEEKDDMKNDDDDSGGGGMMREMEKMEVLSRHARAPSTRIHPPSATPQALRARDEMFGPACRGLGPGAYDVELAKPGLALASSSGTKGRIYRAPTAKNAAQLTLAAERKDGGGASGAGGGYDVARAEKALRKGGGGAAVAMRPPSSASGPTPQQRRKKYWEDKASDARLDHDYMRDTNYSQLLPHAPTVTLHKPTAMDWKSRMLLRQRRLEEEEEEQRRVYSPKRALVEPRSKAPAGMERQVASRAATKRRLDSKPGVAAVMLDKQEAERARHKFYGPQLPIPWGGVGVGNDNGDESPTEEVSRLLTRSQSDARPSRRHGKGGIGSAETDTDATLAYLRSSLAAPASRAAVVMRPAPEVSNQSLLALHESALPTHDFLGPQLQVNWAAESEARDKAHKNKAILFDAQPGRARVSVRQKGEVHVKEFDDWRARPTEPLGPGYYDADKVSAIGDDAKGAVIFSKFVSREEMVGPEGERPTAYEGGIEDVATELAWLAPDRLDFDYGNAKDRKEISESSKRGLALYGKERHPKPKQLTDPLDHRAEEAAKNHVGGGWFEGMAASVKARPAVVDMSKMAGRSVSEAEADEVMEGITGVQADGPVELDVRDWNPHLPRSAPAPVFGDTNKFPRFPPEKPLPPGLADHLGGSHFQGMAEQLAKQPNAANMSRQRGRDDAYAENEAIKAVLGEGEVDVEAALSLAHARAAAIKAAEEKTNPKLKRSQFHADMSKQRGRDDGEKGQEGGLDEGANVEPAPALVIHKVFGASTKGGAARWDKQASRHAAAEDEEATRRILMEQGLGGGDSRAFQRDKDVGAALRLLSAAEGEGEGEGGAGPGTGTGRAAKKGAKEKPVAQRSPRDSVANSRFKAPAPARSWNQDKRSRFDAADSKKTIPDPGPPLTPRGLHFVDPDAGALKGKGGAPLGKGAGWGGSSSMKGKGSSLADELKEDKVMAEIMADLLGRPVEAPPPRPSASASGSALDEEEAGGAAGRGPGRVRFQPPTQQPMSPLPAPSPSVPLPSAAPALRGPKGAREEAGAGAGAGAGAEAEAGAGAGEGAELTLSAAFEKLDAQLGQGKGKGK